MYEVEVLEPAYDFIKSVNPKMKAKIVRAIGLLEQHGSLLPLPHSKKLTGYDLYELRIKLGSDISRMFYFHDNGNFYVVTSGYIKKTNKTSKKEIERALKLKADFQGRKI